MSASPPIKRTVSSPGRLPDFVIIGAAKAGTTTLYEYLTRHPAVFMPTPKEPEFFARDEKWQLGLDWYRSLFADAPPDAVLGEASTRYTHRTEFPEAAPRLLATLEQPKLIYLVREPVSRAFAYWQQRIKTKQNVGYELDPVHGETFEQAIARSDEFVAGSDYMMQLEPFLQAIPRRDLHVMVFEEFVAEPIKHLAATAAFLGIDATPFDHMDVARSNIAADHFEEHTRRQLQGTVERLPGVAALLRHLPSRAKQRGYGVLRQSPLGARIHRRVKPVTMQEQTRRRLRAHFQPSVQRFEAFLGRPIEAWGYT